jgi:hypothetical protein
MGRHSMACRTDSAHTRFVFVLTVTWQLSIILTYSFIWKYKIVKLSFKVKWLARHKLQHIKLKATECRSRNFSILEKQYLTMQMHKWYITYRFPYLTYALKRLVFHWCSCNSVVSYQMPRVKFNKDRMETWIYYYGGAFI